MKSPSRSLFLARIRLIISAVFLIACLVYLVAPIDLIPDLLGPLGWVDDIFALAVGFFFSFRSYRLLKRQS